MRINIYEEELTKNVELLKKKDVNGTEFYGLRFWLETPKTLLDHSTPQDNDECAVTFWARDKSTIYGLVEKAQHAVAYTSV